MSNDNGFIVCSRVGSKSELGLPSSKLEAAVSKTVIEELLKGTLRVASITHDEHSEVISVIEALRSQFPEYFKRQHDRWHKFKRLHLELALLYLVREKDSYFISFFG